MYMKIDEIINDANLLYKKLKMFSKDNQDYKKLSQQNKSRISFSIGHVKSIETMLGNLKKEEVPANYADTQVFYTN